MRGETERDWLEGNDRRTQWESELDHREIRRDAAILGASGHADLAQGIYDRNRESWGNGA